MQLTQLRPPANWRFLVYFTIATAGFVVQVYHVSDEYFQYVTVTQMTIIRPIWTIPPALIFCFYLTMVADRDTASKYGLDSTDEDILEKVTVEQLFEMTPPLDNLIDRCLLKSRGYGLEFKSGADCEKLLVIKKFFKQQSVCYSFTVKDQRRYSLRYLTNSMEGPKF